jgi:hypothetical protein
MSIPLDPFRTFERVSSESLHGRSGVRVGAHYGCNYLVAMARERPLAARHPPLRSSNRFQSPAKTEWACPVEPASTGVA